jgi:hypothetical protein
MNEYSEISLRNLDKRNWVTANCVYLKAEKIGFYQRKNLIKLISMLTGTRNRLTSANAYAMRACASAGGANVDISTCKSSVRCEYLYSPLSLSSSSWWKEKKNSLLKIQI